MDEITPNTGDIYTNTALLTLRREDEVLIEAPGEASAGRVIMIIEADKLYTSFVDLADKRIYSISNQNFNAHFDYVEDAQQRRALGLIFGITL